MVLYHQVLNHVHVRRNLRVVLVVDTRTQRRAVLFSSDTDLDAQAFYRGYKARFQIGVGCGKGRNDSAPG